MRYTGQKDVGYHTLPDLKGTIEYTATDFKNGDTKDVFVKDADFVAPKLYYMDEIRIVRNLHRINVQWKRCS